ncbi:HupE/UreJ family protein [Coralliovum pocilloporae]|uniref:HupE/UreJ family protein n=1 Tax=Coralliovum pocilloporae TaxID=3066369 RepID=UPI003306AF90
MKSVFVAAAMLAAFSSPAFAHFNPLDHSSFMAGFSHPLLGPDHLLVMVAVGLWGGLLGKSALWTLPTAFVAAMVAGFLVALSGVPLPFVEPMILLSVIGLGGLVAMAIRPGEGMAEAIVATAAVFHGHAHGAEMGHAIALEYGAGFVAATAILHAIGLGVALLLFRFTGQGKRAARLTRGLGWLTALLGIWLGFA